jgi:hypothetical protein
MSTKSPIEPILAQFQNLIFVSRTEKLEAVASALESHSLAVQAPILQILSLFIPDAPVRSFWITNEIYVQGIRPNIVTSLLATVGGSIGRISLEEYVYLILAILEAKS